MNRFRLEAPETVAAVLSLLESNGEHSRLLAGGTGLINLMKQRLAFPELLISLHRVPDLADIDLGAAHVRIGALARLAQLERDPIVRRHLPMIVETLGEVASPRIRAMATIGGAMAHGDPHQDLPAALMALGATVVARSGGGERELRLEELYVDYYETTLLSTELLTEVRVPLPATASAASYVKFLPRSAEDYATVAVATRLDLDPASGACQSCRIVLGSVGATPLRAEAAESILIGQPLSAERLRDAAERAREEADPITDARGSAEYKRQMTAVFARRALAHTAAKLGVVT